MHKQSVRIVIKRFVQRRVEWHVAVDTRPRLGSAREGANFAALAYRVVRYRRPNQPERRVLAHELLRRRDVETAQDTFDVATLCGTIITERMKRTVESARYKLRITMFNIHKGDAPKVTVNKVPMKKGDGRRARVCASNWRTIKLAWR